MEQVYNHTQNRPSSHATGLTAKTTDIKNKAENLKATAKTQSESELATTQETDLKSDEKKGTHLDTKAGQLASKADALHTKAKTLETAAGPGTALKDLKGPAQNLKNSAKKEGVSDRDSLHYNAGQLAAQGGNFEVKAEKVIQKFESVQNLYKALSELPVYKQAIEGKSNLEPDKQQLVTDVEKEYKGLEAIYDGMLNLTKLHKAAEALKGAANGGGTLQELKNGATNLAVNVKDLRDQTTRNDYDRAKTVIQNYETVQNAYYRLSDKEKQPDVKDKFEALNNTYSQILKFSKGTTLRVAAGTDPIASPGTLRQLADTLYTRANNLNEKVKKVDSEVEAAKVLRHKAGNDTQKTDSKYLRKLAETLYTAAGQLKSAAQTLYSAAAQIKDASEADLSTLKELADELAKAAGTTTGSDDTSLYKTAEALSSAQTETNAIAVIEAFYNVKAAYETLSTQPKYQQLLKSPSSGAESDAGKVQAVESAWNGVNSQFETLCKALIREFATEVENNARDLASSGSQDHANNVINNFDVVDKAYKELGEQSKVSNEFNDVKQIYERILNLKKLHKLAGELHTAAQTKATELQSPATTLVGNLKTLRDTGDDAQTVKSQFETVKTQFDPLTEEEQKKVQGQFDGLKGAYGHIIIHYPKKLQKAAGKNPSDGLRQLATQLYTKANELDGEIKKAGEDANAAKVLRAKAGDENEEGKLRKLAEKLYQAANALKNVVTSAGPSVNDDSAASNLASAVGASEETDGLRLKLQQLATADASDLNTVKTKASEVKTKYTDPGTGVKQKFEAVKGQESKYNEAGQKHLYEAVVKAWTAFNEVYNPEEQLFTAANGLKEALTTLGYYKGILELHTKAEEVKKKFEGFVNVKSKFDLIKKQASAYDAPAGTFKTQKYDPVENDFDNFNNAYRNVIYFTKFYSIVGP